MAKTRCKCLIGKLGASALSWCLIYKTRCKCFKDKTS